MIGEAGRSALGSRGQRDGWLGGPILLGRWEALGAKVGCFGGRGARRGGKAKSINVCEVFYKTWVK